MTSWDQEPCHCFIRLHFLPKMINHTICFTSTVLYSLPVPFIEYMRAFPQIDRKITVFGLGNNILFPLSVLSSCNSNTNVQFILKTQRTCHLFEKKPSI